MKKINLILASLALVCFTCSSDDNGNSIPVNQPPTAVVLISPTNNGIDKNVSFTYNVPDGDPDGDAIVYDIYLDNGTEELIIAENHNEETFVYDEVLGLNRNYTWHVVAKDGNGGETESETFSFKTRKATYLHGVMPGYFPRRSHTTVLFENNLVIMSGQGADGLEDLVRQSQNGLSWSAAPSELPERIEGASVVFNSKIYTVGGGSNLFLPSPLNDVYELSNLTGAWVEVPVTESFTPRSGHSLVVFNNAMHIIGGKTGVNDFLGEALTSTDGANWTMSNANAQFGERGNHTSVVFNDKIWMIGGRSNSGFNNDVWSTTNGVDWVLETENAAFSPRSRHSSVVYDNKIWVYGGFNGDTDAYFGDLWYSEDGINWHEAGFEAGDDPLPDNLRDAALAIKNVGGNEYMYVIGGVEDVSGVNNHINYVLRID